MQTKPMAHQVQALARSAKRSSFAFLMEQGTGKTWVAMADAERSFADSLIDGVLVIAPKGVHTNWVRREIPAHLSVPHVARSYSSGAGKRAAAKRDEVFKTPRDQLAVFAMNIDALIHKEGFDLAQRFLLSRKAMLIVDESDSIKNPDAARTKRLMRLRHLSRMVRIMTGTPITNAPADIFSQFEFMESGLLGTTSYRAFVAEYAELVDMKDVTHENFHAFQTMLKRNPKMAHAQIIATNPDGSKKWRNLDKLQRLILPHAFRVLKKECLDLPDKVYQQHFFTLTAAQMRAYELMEKELRIEAEDGEMTPVKALAALVKLQQITSGFIVKPNQEGTIYIPDGNPRLGALIDIIERIPGKVIVWARFHEELDCIAAELRAVGRRVVEYHGRIRDREREEAVDSFQNGDADVFVGQGQSGGVGLTLTAAEHTIYYSNDFNLRTRLQSEDRNHRIGTKRSVVYIDLVAEDTVDEAITRSLQRKAELAATILGDRGIDLRGLI